MRVRNLILSLFLVLGASAQADLVSTFKSIDGNRKGPFSLNYLQGSRGRGVVNSSGSSGTFQFQAAFRNNIGKELATQYDFYVANLFTTNYYELMGEYVYGDQYSSHDIDQAALLSKADVAMPKAASMVRHWLLEKHYLEHFPDSALTKAFQLRGISDVANEQTYAQYFFNFYLSSLRGDFQYLPAFLLIGDSPAGEFTSLNKARDLVASSYDYFNARWGSSDVRVKRLYRLRNMIHNQLSEDVIAEIDRYVADFPFYKQEGNTYLFEVKKILVAYYSASAKVLSEKAKRLGFSDLQAIADGIEKNGSTTATLLELSKMAANLRTRIGDASLVANDKRTEVLLLISRTSQFLNKELNSLASVQSKDTLLTTLNVVYMEGFLIKDNWEYFVGEISAAADLKSAAAVLVDVIDIGNDTLNQAVTPALAQWISIEPKMQYFIDNTIKSSALNTASITIEKVK